jgi:hypothetical protein
MLVSSQLPCWPGYNTRGVVGRQNCLAASTAITAATLCNRRDLIQRPATYYRDQSEHARRKATAARPGSDMQKSWLEIADSYERLAQVAEQVERDDQV